MKTIDSDLKQATLAKQNPQQATLLSWMVLGGSRPRLPCLPLISNQKFAFYIPGFASVGQEMETLVGQLTKPSATSTVSCRITEDLRLSRFTEVGLWSVESIHYQMQGSTLKYPARRQRPVHCNRSTRNQRDNPHGPMPTLTFFLFWGFRLLSFLTQQSTPLLRP